MNKKGLHIFRRFLIGMTAMQFLNMSVCSEVCWDNDYDYSYAYNKTFDPTETAVELIIEMKYGQQQAFTYDHRTDTNKNTAGAIHWHTDLRVIPLSVPDKLKTKCMRWEDPAKKILSMSPEIISPPPEAIPA